MRWLRVLPAVVGLGFGVLAVLAKSHWADARHAVPAADAEADVSSADKAALRRRIERLERRQALEQGDPSKRRAPDPPAQESAPGEAKLASDPEPERPSASDFFASRLDEHKKEAIDPEWGPAAQKSLALGVDRVIADKKLPARVLAVHCATVSCSVDLEWPSFAEAARTYAEFVHTNEYSESCSRGLILPEPADRNAHYRATLLLSCEEERAASAG